MSAAKGASVRPLAIYGVTLPAWRSRVLPRNESFSSGAGSWAASEKTSHRFSVLEHLPDVPAILEPDEPGQPTRHERAARLRPARAWLDAHCDPERTTVYVGIDWSEQHRMGAVVKNYLPFRAVAPLCEPPYLDKDAVLADLREQGVQPPRLYDLGFAHANCGGGCVRAGQGQFAHLLAVMPARYAWWEHNEQELRTHLGKDVAILRDRRGGRTVPLTLRAFRERHEAVPEQTDLFDIGGCGCFVDEGDAA